MCINRAILTAFKGYTGFLDQRRLKKKTPFDGVDVAVDIAYLDSGNMYHLLDIYYPAGNTKKLPVIIDIHGGGWIYGTKENNKHYCMGIAKQGFVVVNINYRLLPEGKFPGIIEDIFAAFNWVNDNIADYNGDLNNVFLTGDSAGAHLASVAVAIMVDDELKNRLNLDCPLVFRALALTCGVADLEVYANTKFFFFKYLHTIFFGKDYKSHPFIKNATIKNNNLEQFPPIFLNTSYKDFMKKQVFDFADECKRRGVEYELKYFSKQESKNKLTHVYSILYPEWQESIETTNALTSFFRKYMVN